MLHEDPAMNYDEHLENEVHRGIRQLRVHDDATAAAACAIIEGLEKAIATEGIPTDLAAEFERDATAFRTKLTAWEATEGSTE